MKILLVDDHALIRDALRGVLQELKSNAAIFEAASCSEAMRVISAHPDLDLVLLDLSLPDRDGIALLPELRERHPATSVVVLSAYNDRANIMSALELGALGFIPKSATRNVMINALRLVFAGGIYIPAEILAGGKGGAAARRPASMRSAAELGLTGRQIEVLGLMMQGKSNKAICRALDLSGSTVKNHVTAILRALKVTNRTAAVIAAASLDIVPPVDS